MINSRNSLRTNYSQFPYSTSDVGSDYQDLWIQESISHQELNVTDQIIINGLYVQTENQKIIFPANEPNLLDEFQAWDKASDEALDNFEKKVD
jgi:hypothetical protein